MSKEQIIKILEYHNLWRRGEDEDLKMLTPKIIGVAIDEAIKMLRELK